MNMDQQMQFNAGREDAAKGLPRNPGNHYQQAYLDGYESMLKEMLNNH